MPVSPARRRLATVLFVDVVGSTALTSRIGDERWREILGRFHWLVRSEVRRQGGRQQDTAGDGVFATFPEPVRAIAAAASIIEAVHGLGLDVRGGIHTGEVGEVDGKLQGIAVSIGARIVALAGPAEVAVTGTVRDLVVGSDVTFADTGTHELKGVEGSWRVFSLRGVAGRPLPSPLSPAEAEERLGTVVGARAPLWRRRRLLLLALALLLVAAAIAAALLARGGGSPKPAAAARPVSLVQLDGYTGQVRHMLRHDALGRGQYQNLWIASGTLWQLVGNQHARLVERRLPSGRVVQTLPLGLDACSCRVAFGYGSVWLLHEVVALTGASAGLTHARLDGSTS
jgi:class 3 adenylate cyclase